MTYLFLGEDTAAKDVKLREIKQKAFPNSDALQFDFEVLHAYKLEPEILKKSLMALPAVAPQRLVMIREGQKLTAHHKEILLEFIQGSSQHCILVIDVETSKEEDAFVKKISTTAQVIRFQQQVSSNAFDLARAVTSGQTTQALEILSQILTSGDHPLQIMGALVWQWQKSRRQIPTERFKKGLLALQEADFNIKRSRLKAEHAMEILIVKLST
ncbi:MAG: hypothetical protein WC676_02610 [Candidatus Omnitrophota bacterium]